MAVEVSLSAVAEASTLLVPTFRKAVYLKQGSVDRREGTEPRRLKIKTFNRDEGGPFAKRA